ncbi:PREDICTED: transcription factor TFIIIB component B'' homolog isoform X2 [Nicotiana attenuata]|uniref:Tudor domain-containing protein n=1 Tax=Nicotiana attenuata TaxID=49451 RepID=A0A1J6IPT1_NICAT|nr:PREDICTED: transcription factor TFIIIB component B'' homolog isoform X2 [Nicotiana attenuata]OIT02584.1 hypothetical protein A4A49_06220 [Nicotiana attenuata]
MSASNKELEEQLAEAGNKLLQPPSSLDELIILLDQVEFSLSKVEQSPAESMHDALSPLMKALVANDLLRHSDLDVKVAVASCISEITRITAPDAPYDDEKMKDVFQLIVSSFENLHDQSSRSYNKRVLILETVAKVRSCVVMLDLECDKLITEMFQHFLKAIREDHPENIFSSMATIMTLVLEESEEVPLELLTPLLASVKKDNEEATPIAKRLGEKVFANCAEKLKPYLTQAVESLHISLDEYNKIVTSVCEGTLPAVGHINDSVPKEQLAAEGKLADLPEAAPATQMAESIREEARSEDIDPTVNRSPKSIISNGVSQENVGSAAEAELLANAGGHDEADLQDAAKTPSKSESDDLRAGKSTNSESKSEQTAKKRGKRTNSSNSAESSHQACDDSEKEAGKLPDHQNNQNKNDQSSASEDPAVEQSNSLEEELETTLQDSAPKESEGEAVNVAPSSTVLSLPDESAPKKGGRRKEDSLNQEECVSEKESEATSDLEVKQVRRPSKKAPSEPSHKENEGGSTSDGEAKKQKKSGKKIDIKNKNQVGPSVRNKEDSKKRGRGKASPETAPPQESPDDSAKHECNEEDIPRTSAKKKPSSGKGREIVPSPESPDNSAKHESNEEETPRTSAKRKQRSSGKDKVSETVQHGESLVGKKIKVWWPLDKEFYEGVVEKFDSAKKKYRVVYTDGDVETINLTEERWKLVEDDPMSEGEQIASADAASERQKKKKPRNAESSAKHARVEASPKSKSKDTTTKSGQKSKDDGKLKHNLKDGTSKSGGRTDDTTSSKSKAQSKKSSGKSVDDTEKPSARSKDVSSTPKSKSKQDTPSSTANKSKQETVTAAVKSKNKTPQSGGKPSANGMEKLKSSSSKVKGSGNEKEKATNLAKNPDSSSKGKFSSASKERESEAKSGKKRGRGKN